MVLPNKSTIQWQGYFLPLNAYVDGDWVWLPAG